MKHQLSRESRVILAACVGLYRSGFIEPIKTTDPSYSVFTSGKFGLAITTSFWVLRQALVANTKPDTKALVVHFKLECAVLDLT